jgi:integrase
MKIEITDLFLRKLAALKPDDEYWRGLTKSGNRIEVSDTKRTGLRIRIYLEHGSLVERRFVWMFEKRIKGGSKRKHTFGKWPEISLSDARKRVIELELEAMNGIDRIQNEKQKKLELEAAKAELVTIGEVIEAYDKLHLIGLRTRDERKRQLTQSLEKHLNKSIGSLSRKDLQAAVDQKAMSGHRPYANRIRAALMAFSSWAWQRGYTKTNVGAGIAKAIKETPRERVISIEEMRVIFNATFELEGFWGSIIRLLILTGQRRGEILELKWSEVDLAKAHIIKPGSKTKNGKPHVTHISPPALQELQALDKNRIKKVDWVFTSTGTTPASGIGKAKKRLDQIIGTDFEHWRLHDIRTGIVSALAEAGESEGVVDRILNHSATGSAPSAVSRHYIQAALLEHRARALDKWANIVTGTDSGKVVKLHKT